MNYTIVIAIIKLLWKIELESILRSAAQRTDIKIDDHIVDVLDILLDGKSSPPAGTGISQEALDKIVADAVAGVK